MSQLHDVELDLPPIDPTQMDGIARGDFAPDGHDAVPAERIAETDRILLMQSDVRARALERSAQEIRQFALDHIASIYGRPGEKLNINDDGTFTRGPINAAPRG